MLLQFTKTIQVKVIVERIEDNFTHTVFETSGVDVGVWDVDNDKRWIFQIKYNWKKNW